MLTIGTLSFNTKADAERHIRTVLESHRPALRIRPLSPSASELAAALLDLHPHRDVVIGPGIDSFHCELLPDGNLRFTCKRIDGTFWEFSWRNCISPPSGERRLLTVMRHEVARQIEDYRATLRFPVKCAVSGEWLHSGDCHIDHEHPDTFKAMAEKWLLLTGYSPDSIAIKPKQYAGGRPSIVDRIIAKQWQAYHRSHARLRPVSVRANLSTLRKTK